MKAIKCEMCNSNDIVKIEGLYVCQSCGTKYSVDEAKKMMYDLDVTEDGKVKVDNSEEINSIIQLARKAKASNNFYDAEKYYNTALMKDANNWEAYFYSAYCKLYISDDSKINDSIDIYKNSVFYALDLIYSGVENGIEKDRAILEVSNKTVVLCNNLCERVNAFYENRNLNISKATLYNNNLSTFGAISSMSEKAKNNISSKEVKRRVCAVLYNIADYIEENFYIDKNLVKIINAAWGNGNALAKKYDVYDSDLGTYYDDKIKKYKSVIEHKVKYCSNCGLRVTEKASFCRECGNRIN